jgi:hypothetical protein
MWITATSAAKSVCHARTDLLLFNQQRLENAMNKLHILAFVALLPLAACGKNHDATTTAQADDGFIAGKVREGIEQAKKEIETKNIDLRGAIRVSASTTTLGTQINDPRPKAEITPAGDFLIDGKTITVTPEQKAMLLDYRKQIVGIAMDAADIGASAATLGLSAAKEALWGVLSGDGDKAVEKKVEAKVGPIKQAAKQLCNRLPDLLSSQQKLAASIPEFKPYATMTQQDIADCARNIDEKGGAAVFAD